MTGVNARRVSNLRSSKIDRFVLSALAAVVSALTPLSTYAYPVFITEQNIDQTRTYRLTRDIVEPGTAIFVTVPNVIIDLQGHTITFGTDGRVGASGIYPFKQRSSTKLGGDDQNYPETVTRRDGRNTTVQNGRIVWGGAGKSPGSWATGIAASYGVDAVTVKNMEIRVGGQDGMCINLRYTALNLFDTLCVDDSTTTENRHQTPAAIKSDAKVVASRNIIVGGLSAIVAGGDSEISQNFLRQSGFATNGYGVLLYRNNNSKVFDNVIVPTNGRGIMYNAGENHVARNNLIVVHERPNAEFGEALNAPCFRLRYEVDKNTIESNKCFAVGGGQNAAASGIYLSDYSAVPARKNRIAGNDITALLSSDGPTTNLDLYVNAITFEAHGTASNYTVDDISGNSFASNNYLMRIDGWDGAGFQGPVVGNSFDWTDGSRALAKFTAAFDDARYQFSYPATNRYVTASLLSTLRAQARAEVTALLSGIPDRQAQKGRATFYTGYTGASAVTVLDSRFGPGVGTEASDVFVQFDHKGPSTIIIGVSSRVKLLDSAGGPLANRAVTTTSAGGISSSGTTDANGIVQLTVPTSSLTRNAGEGGARKTSAGEVVLRIAGFRPYRVSSTILGTEASPITLTPAAGTGQEAPIDMPGIGGGSGVPVTPTSSSDTDGDGVTDADEARDGTSASDPGSVRTRLASPAFVPYSRIGNERATLELANTGTTPLTAQLTLYHANGAAVAQASYTIAAKAVTPVGLNALLGTRYGKGIVKIDFAGGELHGALVTDLLDLKTADFIYAYPAPIQPTYTGTTVIPGFATGHGSSTAVIEEQLQLVNPTDQQQTMVFKVFNKDGKPIRNADLPVAARSVRAVTLAVDGMFQVEVSSAGRYQAYLTHRVSTAAGKTVLASAIQARKATSNPLSVSVPRISGAGWRSSHQVQVVNFGDKQVSVRMDLYNQAGQMVWSAPLSLPARSHSIQDRSYLLTADTVGHIEFVPPVGSSVGVQQIMTFTAASDGSLVTAYSTAARSPFSGNPSAPFDRVVGQSNRWMVSNLGTGAASVMTESRNGEALYSQDSSQLAARNSFSRQNTAPADSRGLSISTVGSARVTANGIRILEVGKRIEYALPFPGE